MGRGRWSGCVGTTLMTRRRSNMTRMGKRREMVRGVVGRVGLDGREGAGRSLRRTFRWGLGSR